MNPISTIELAAVPRTDLALTMVKVEAAVAAAAPFNTVLRETSSFFFIVFSSVGCLESRLKAEQNLFRLKAGLRTISFSGSLLRAKFRRLFCRWITLLTSRLTTREL